MRRESVSPNKIHGDAYETDIVEAIYVQLQNCDCKHKVLQTYLLP